MEARNPILPGFHPDPSICRVGDDYYLATSTFEWFPGVALFHSRDLVHWRPIGHALTRHSQLDLIGAPNSGGVWAPCLTHADGQFWVAFTNVRNWGAATMDTPNYLVTAPAIEGPWSEPLYLNSSGFDPSLFHDRDGRKWLLNMQWDHRPGKNSFAGILLQQYDASAGRLVGPVHNIFRGSPLGFTEGPHLYRHGDYYYLLTAEGGTEYGHTVTLARSRTLEGPYELHPDNPILSARDAPQAALQKTGHASLVETLAGEWHMVFLCGRPLPGTRYCPLGRETAIIACEWTDAGWLQPDHGRVITQGVADAASGSDGVEEIRFAELSILPPQIQTLRREPSPEWLSLTERPGWLRLVGGESLRSLHRQSLVARRLEHFCARAETCVDFASTHFQQMAGLAAYYDTHAFYALLITHDESLGRCLRLWDGVTHTEPAVPVALPAAGSVWLAVTINFNSTCFEYSLDGKAWNSLGPNLETACLSDEWDGKLRFTGTMLALTAQDLSGGGKAADFAYLNYGPLYKTATAHSP